MIFCCVNAGHYIFIENDKVIAEVRRGTRRSKLNPKWIDSFYTVRWYDSKFTDRLETFNTLRELGAKYEFENYPAYGKLLHG